MKTVKKATTGPSEGMADAIQDAGRASRMLVAWAPPWSRMATVT